MVDTLGRAFMDDGSSPKGLPLDGVPDAPWSVFDGRTPFPVGLVRESAVDANRRALTEFCTRHDVWLAPHGKTTMAPGLFRRQLEDGSWAITAATVWQAKRMHDAGIPRVFIANQVVVPAEIAWMAEATSDDFEVWCYVDSLDGVEIMNRVLAEVTPPRPLPVVVERGVQGGRTGVRSVADGVAVAEAAAAAPHLELRGVAGFEGILGAEGDRTAAEVVTEFLDQVVELGAEIGRRGLFAHREVIVTAGGSAYFDHVVDRFSRLDIQGHDVRTVIRSGGYISHDEGGLHRSSPMGATPRTDAGRLVPAIEVWGVVLSRPEPTRALVGIGKRDASADGQLPVAKKVYRAGAVRDIEPIQVVTINDQHAYLDLDPDDPLRVGEFVGFGISHPCTTFDKWRTMLLVDDDYRVVELIDTLF
jgi:D-serine dehydratase